jgi:hypothetical protein
VIEGELAASAELHPSAFTIGRPAEGATVGPGTLGRQNDVKTLAIGPGRAYLPLYITFHRYI